MVGKTSVDKASKKRTKSRPIGETSTFKSTEFVADSDDAAPSGAPVQKTQRKTVSFAPKSIGKAPSKNPLAASAQPHEVKKILKKKTKTPSVSEAESESSEGEKGEESGGTTTVEDTSEEESSPRHESPIKGPPDASPAASPQRTSDTKVSYNVKPVNGVKRKAEEELSRNETAGGDESDNNEEEAEEEEESDDDEDDEGSSNDESSATSEQSSVAKTTKEDVAAQAVRIRTDIVSYKPPAGFEKAKIQTSSVQKTTELFTPANLEGKQIWHITAPSQLPIDSIMEVSATSLKDGSSILSYKDSDYGLVPQAGKPEEALLVTRNNRYQSSKTPLSRTLHIRQLVRLPNHLSQAETSTNAANQNHTPVHQQPPGLHMRFQPFGLSSDSDSDSGGVSRAKQPHSIPQTEQVVERTSPSKKRKQKDDVPKQPTTSLPVERKKPRPTVDANTGIEGSDRSKAEAPTVPGKRSKSSGKSASREMNNVNPDISANHDGDSETGSHLQKTKATEAPASTKKPKVNGVHTAGADTPTNTTNDSKETPEQRAHRKAEKRRRKALQQQSQSSTTQESQPLLPPVSSSSSSKAQKSSSSSSSKRDSNTAAARAKASSMPLAEYSARLSSAEARSPRPPSSPPPSLAAEDIQRSPVQQQQQQQPNEDALDDGGKMSATKRGKRKEEKEKEKKRHKRASRVTEDG